MSLSIPTSNLGNWSGLCQWFLSDHRPALLFLWKAFPLFSKLYKSHIHVTVASEMNCCSKSGIHEHSSNSQSIHIQIFHRIARLFSTDFPDHGEDSFHFVGCVRRYLEVVVPCRFCTILTFLVNWRTGSVCKGLLPSFTILRTTGSSSWYQVSAARLSESSAGWNINIAMLWIWLFANVDKVCVQYEFLRDQIFGTNIAIFRCALHKYSRFCLHLCLKWMYGLSHRSFSVSRKASRGCHDSDKVLISIPLQDEV